MLLQTGLLYKVGKYQAEKGKGERERKRGTKNMNARRRRRNPDPGAEQRRYDKARA